MENGKKSNQKINFNLGEITVSELREWLDKNEHLPVFMRDFHDQKDLFKKMHSLYQDSEGAKDKPTWVQGQIYTIDWFLWYMASRGYTLQKCRKKIEYIDL